MWFRENTVKIVATIGPASSSPEMLKNLIDAGVDVFRLNFSHGTHEEKKEVYDKIRKISDSISILADIQGPKIRVGKFKDDKAYVLNFGQEVKVYDKELEDGGDQEKFSIILPGLVKTMRPGDVFYVNDGIIKIRVKKREKDHLVCEVIAGGTISNNKGVNIPSKELTTRVPTEKDIKDLEFIAKLDPEFVAISFVADSNDVLKVKRLLENFGNGDIKLISKIERPIALENIDEILEVSDGIMVARGDLGVEISPDQVPIKQKELIYKCNKEGKPVIVATQMLESMINTPIPTRAEANDIYNAVLDGHTQTLGHAIYSLAGEMEELNFRGKILVITRTGFGARMISKFRPPLPIIAMTPFKRTARELNLIWGVQPVYIENIDFFNLDAESLIEESIKFGVDNGVLDENEHVIILLVSRKFQKRGNLVGLYYVGEILEKNT
ncbi:MAG: pyruvate kinase [Promethearchaeota archaeon]